MDSYKHVAKPDQYPSDAVTTGFLYIIAYRGVSSFAKLPTKSVPFPRIVRHKRSSYSAFRY